MDSSNIIPIMLLYLILLSLFLIGTKKFYVIAEGRFYLRDPKFKGLFKSKEIREKRKKLGKIFFAIFSAGFILCGVVAIFFGGIDHMGIIVFTLVLLSITFFLLSCFTYGRAIQDEVLEEFMLEREKPTFKNFCEKEIREKRKKLKIFFTLGCGVYIFFAILYIFFPMEHPIAIFVIELIEITLWVVGIFLFILVDNLFLYIKFLNEEILSQGENQKVKSQENLNKRR